MIPSPNSTNGTQMKRILSAILLVALVVIGGSVAFGRWKADKKASMSEQERARGITEARSQVVAALKDPGSVQYRNDAFFKDRSTICGEFNAKNSMGGYAGFKRYIGKPDQFVIEGGSLSTWKLSENRSPAPDYMPVGIEMIERANLSNATALQVSSARVMTEEIFEWLWGTNCK